MNRKERRTAHANARREGTKATREGAKRESAERSKKHKVVLGGARPEELSPKEMAVVLCIAGYVPHLNRTLPGNDFLDGLHVHVIFANARQTCIQWKPSEKDFDTSYPPPPDDSRIPDDPTGQRWQLVVANGPESDTEANRKTMGIIFRTMLSAVLRMERSLPGDSLLDGLHVHFIRSDRLICARYVREGDEEAVLNHPNVPTLH